jgi:hypothetical protein
MVAKRSTDAIGDDAVVAATGRPRAQWFTLLDEADATGWSHKDIAAWLQAEQGMDGWWAQSITVAYEQERGMRAPGQRSDGTYEVSPSKSLACTLAQAYGLVADESGRARWLDGALSSVGAGDRSAVVGATPTTSVRLAWPAGALGAPEDQPGRVVVGLYQSHDDAGKPRGKVRVSVQHGGLADRAVAEQLKAFWKARLDDLAKVAAEA